MPALALNEFSAREIQTFAEDLEKITKTKELKKDTLQQEFSTEIKVALMTRLGIPLAAVSSRHGEGIFEKDIRQGILEDKAGLKSGEMLVKRAVELSRKINRSLKPAEND